MSAHLSWLTHRADDGSVEVRKDYGRSLTSKLGRGRSGATYLAAPDPTADFGTQVGALADLVAWALHEGQEDVTLEIAIGPQPKQAAALSTLAAVGESLSPTWTLRLVEIDSEGAEVTDNNRASAVGDHPNAVRWARYLETWQEHQPDGLAAEVVDRLDDLRVTLHPQLSQKWRAGVSWQLRVEGLQVGTVGSRAGTLWVGNDGKAGGQSTARRAWLSSGGEASRWPFDDADDAVRMVRGFMTQLEGRPPFLGVLLDHGQPEHALESGILRDRVDVVAPDGTRLTVPYDDPRVTWAGQTPTVWNEHASKARYSDVLLAQGRTPWIIELKVPGEAGGWGAYLRKGIHQCVLYRRFLQQATPYASWMEGAGLDHTRTRAALAYPDEGRAGHVRGLANLGRTAAVFDVPVLELAVGAPSTSR